MPNQKNTNIHLMVATDQDDNIGLDNALPWPKCQEDMAYFKHHTMHNVVVMGSNTARSLGKPLDGRINVVMSRHGLNDTRNIDLALKGFKICQSIAEVLTIQQDALYKYNDKEMDIWVIGGNQIYTHWLSSGLVDDIYWNVIKGVYPADTKFEMGGYIKKYWSPIWSSDRFFAKDGDLFLKSMYIPKQYHLPFNI